VHSSRTAKPRRSSIPKNDRRSHVARSGVAPIVHDNRHAIETARQKPRTTLRYAPRQTDVGCGDPIAPTLNEPAPSEPKLDERRTRKAASRKPNWMRTIRRFQPSCHPTNVNPHECGSTTTGNECATPSFDSSDMLDPPKRAKQRPEDHAEARAFRYRTSRQHGPSTEGVRGLPVLARRATPCHPGDGGV